ncbi:MAG: RNA polymerase sigma factor RpoD/SigA [Bacteroidales bacterium]|nr:RNA polymerase sigma factor RpoD/SigA [Bacteroidales bacterium]
MKSQQIKEPAVDKESALKKYFDEIKDTKPLTKEEETELAQRIHNGDEKAKQELIKANLKFVVFVAKNYQHRGLDLEDLINDGNIGLVKAAERFDETKGYRFISYAVWWIRESILEDLAMNGRTIRLPRKQIELIGKINTTIKEFELEHGRIPTAEEISKILDVVDKKVQLALESSSRVESIDSTLTEDDDRTILDKYDAPDSVTADKELIDEETSAEFKSILSVISPQGQYVIGHLFGIGYEKMTLEKIAERLDLPKEKIQQIKEKGIRQLRTRTKNKRLKKLLENL